MKAGWKTSTLGDTCEMYQPKTISGKEMVEDGAYPVFGANGVIGRYDKFNHEEPQLLITCRGATCGTVNVSEPKSWITGNAMVVRPKDDSIELQFLEYLFRGGIDIARAITGAAQPQITRTNLAPLDITYPVAIEEQRRIVGILDEAFEGLATAKANAEQNLQNARALFESHLQAVFTQRGDGWVEKSLGDLISIQNGFAFKSNEYTESGYFVIRIGNVQDGEITLDNPKYIQLADKKLERFILNEGDILISLTGNIGRVGILQESQLPAVLNQRVARITVSSRNANRDFIFRFLSSRTFRDGLQEAGHGAAQQNVSTKEIESVRISIPDATEQHRIVKCFDAFAEETQRLESLYQRKLAALDELKKSLLHRAFSGQL